MGKGSDDPFCRMGRAGMAGLLEAPEEDPLRPKITSDFNQAAQKDKQEASGGINAESGSRKMEKTIREIVSETYDEFARMCLGDPDRQEINRFFAKQKRKVRAALRDGFSDNLGTPEGAISAGQFDWQELSPLQQAGLLFALKNRLENLLPADLNELPMEARFHADFFGSPDFIKHWILSIGDTNLADKKLKKSSSGKTAEDDWRQAVMAVVGLEYDDINNGRTIGTWVSPDSGRAYTINVVSEYGENAYFDLAIHVVDQQTGEEALFTNQHKSTMQNTQPKGEETSLDAEPKERDIMLVRLTKAPKGDKTDVHSYAREFQERLFANDTITDTSPYMQRTHGSKGRMQQAIHTSMIVDPRVHKAVARYPRLGQDFHPETKDGDYHLRSKGDCRLVARIPVRGIKDKDGKPVEVELESGVCVRMKDGQPQRNKKGDGWEVDQKLTAATDDSVTLKVPKEATIPLHRVRTASRSILEGMLGSDGKLKKEYYQELERLGRKGII